MLTGKYMYGLGKSLNVLEREGWRGKIWGKQNNQLAQLLRDKKINVSNVDKYQNSTYNGIKIDNDVIYLNTYNKKQHNITIKFINIIDNTYCIKNIMIGMYDKSINISDIHCNEISNDNIIDIFPQLYPNFDFAYYCENNKLLNGILYHNNNTFLKYHWYYCGRYNLQIYFKYLLHKYKDIILKIKIPLLRWTENNINTLLFVDDRYDSSFIYLLILFVYSVNITWNITIFTTHENKAFYENDFKRCNLTGKIIIIDKIRNYSKLLRDETFWRSIREENCLLFQYDSFAMGKFDDVFFNYNYIGAKWDHSPTNIKGNYIGNGGTSFRKVRIMESICKKYKNSNRSEDIFFSEKLALDGLHNCTEEIADKFSFENIYNENSIYGHQIYNSIGLDKLDEFIRNKIV
mgnify:CR=1 FL=1